MSNLVEKSLIIGFGVFSLIIFLSIIAPFLNVSLKNYINDEKTLESYNNFIEKVDAGVYYVIANPNNEFSELIDFPSYMNISISENEISYYFKLDSNIVSKHNSYSKNFFNAEYKDYPSQKYSLKIYFELELLKVLFIKL
jgi:hypothetical protein